MNPPIVTFVETEADVATDPVFSKDVLHVERKKGPARDKVFTTTRWSSNSNSFVTSTAQLRKNNTPTSSVSSLLKDPYAPQLWWIEEEKY